MEAPPLEETDKTVASEAESESSPQSDDKKEQVAQEEATPVADEKLEIEVVTPTGRGRQKSIVFYLNQGKGFKLQQIAEGREGEDEEKQRLAAAQRLSKYPKKARSAAPHQPPRPIWLPNNQEGSPDARKGMVSILPTGPPKSRESASLEIAPENLNFRSRKRAGQMTPTDKRVLHDKVAHIGLAAAAAMKAANRKQAPAAKPKPKPQPTQQQQQPQAQPTTIPATKQEPVPTVTETETAPKAETVTESKPEETITSATDPAPLQEPTVEKQPQTQSAPTGEAEAESTNTATDAAPAAEETETTTTTPATGSESVQEPQTPPAPIEPESEPEAVPTGEDAREAEAEADPEEQAEAQEEAAVEEAEDKEEEEAAEGVDSQAEAEPKKRLSVEGGKKAEKEADYSSEEEVEEGRRVIPRRSRSIHRKNIDTPEERKGWAEKYGIEGYESKAWARRYFVLAYPFLDIYDQPEGSRKGRISMRGGILLDEELLGDEEFKEYASTSFKISADAKRKLILRFETPEEKEGWAKALWSNIYYANPAKRPSGVDYRVSQVNEDKGYFTLNTGMAGISLYLNEKKQWHHPFHHLRTIVLPEDQEGEHWLTLDFSRYGGSQVIHLDGTPPAALYRSFASLFDACTAWHESPLLKARYGIGEV